MAETIYGYSSGNRTTVQLKLDSATSTIVVGDMLALSTAGFYARAAAGDQVHAVAMQASAAPTSDGGATILADVSRETVYRFPPATGSTVAADAGLSFDVGGAQSVDRTASVDGITANGALRCVRVDTTANLMYVQLASLYAGV